MLLCINDMNKPIYLWKVAVKICGVSDSGGRQRGEGLILKLRSLLSKATTRSTRSSIAIHGPALDLVASPASLAITRDVRLERSIWIRSEH